MRKPLLVVALSLLFAAPIHANTIYSYTGNPFTFVFDSTVGIPDALKIVGTDFLTIQITLAAPLPPSLNSFNLHSLGFGLLSFKASNGKCTAQFITAFTPIGPIQGGDPLFVDHSSVTTNAAGAI